MRKLILILASVFLLSCTQSVYQSHKQELSDTKLYTKEATLELPKFHFAYGLQPGQYTVKSGIIVEHLPDGSRTQTLVAGVPLKQQPIFMSEKKYKRDLLGDQLGSEAARKFSDWSSDYWDQYLPPQKQTDLKKLRQNFLVEDTQLKQLLKTERIDREQFLRLKSKNLADFILKRRDLVKGHKKAEFHLYKKQLPDKLPKVDKKELEQAIYYFISGEYLINRKRKQEKEDAKIKNSYRTWKMYDPPWDDVDDMDYPKPNCNPHKMALETRRVIEDTTPETLSYNVSIFVAEHVGFIGDDWFHLSYLFEENDIKHTSIVAMIDKYTKKRRTVKIYNGNTLIKEKSWDIYMRDPVPGSKELVNGCGGDYGSEDYFKLCYLSTHETLSQAEKFIHQYEPPYKIRGGAYSAGCFGSDFVCHQTCNSFAYKKWNIVPVTYNISTDMFGYFGDRSISPDTDSCGRTHRGCIPGAGCYYNTNNKCPPGCGSGEIPSGGPGTGLSQLWNPVDEEWVASEIKYDEEPISNRFGPSGHWEYESCPEIPPGPQACAWSSQCPDGYKCLVQPVNGQRECSGRSGEECVCMRDYEPSPPPPPPPPDPIHDYLGLRCTDKSECGPVLWCLNSSRCGPFPKFCESKFGWDCPKGWDCGKLIRSQHTEDWIFKECSNEELGAHECRCEKGPPWR